MVKASKYPVVERALRGLITMLLVEFVLGVILTTVVGYDPHKHSGAQTGFLVAHIIVGIGLLVGSLAHIFTARSSRLLGPKPIVGFVCIVGALGSGGAAASNGSTVAVLLMALFFAAALVTYGLSYLAVKADDAAQRKSE